LKLFIISQDVNNGYDTYDSAVVCAPNEETARYIHPSGGTDCWGTNSRPPSSLWCNNPSQVQVKYIGEADPSIKQGVILASFNAG